MPAKETNDRALRILEDLQHDQSSRFNNRSLLIEDLKELGMFGELSDDSTISTCRFKTYIVYSRQ
jgi:hypothetical protein